MITADRQQCFQLKASFSPCTILQLVRCDWDALARELAEMIAKAPNFFSGSPVVIDLEKVKEWGEISFSHLKQILCSAGLAPIGVRGGSAEQMAAASDIGLPSVAIGKSSSTSEKKAAEPAPLSTRLITHPIRSGMQVYAREGDLIVLSQVSVGAEVLADGHIHVYGALRGRALAGVQGNTQARIFCSVLEAELVSIAGYYLTKEDMQALPLQEGMLQIYLENEQVKIKPC